MEKIESIIQWIDEKKKKWTKGKVIEKNRVVILDFFLKGVKNRDTLSPAAPGFFFFLLLSRIFALRKSIVKGMRSGYTCFMDFPITCWYTDYRLNERFIRYTDDWFIY